MSENNKDESGKNTEKPESAESAAGSKPEAPAAESETKAPGDEGQLKAASSEPAAVEEAAQNVKSDESPKIAESAGSEKNAESSKNATSAKKPDTRKEQVNNPIPQAAPAKKGSSFIGWLALLLVLALAGAAGWSVQQGLEREVLLKQRIGELENSTGNEQADLDAMQKKLRGELASGLGEAKSESARQTQMLDLLQSQMTEQQEKLASYSANDHEAWLRAEAQYLLRLANQRLIMARDVESAQALLGSADSILRELDDPGLHDVRAALAGEQAALRAVPRIDVEGIYLRLSALVEQADSLVIFQMPEQEAQPEREESDDWQMRLERGYEEAARKLSDYIVIRRRDVPMHALMDPQWEGLVRQNLRMLLEQAQVALLSGNQTLYEESLQRSQHWVAQFFDTDEAASRAMAREITQLEGQTVETMIPDVTRSLRALDKAMKEQLQPGGDE